MRTRPVAHTSLRVLCLAAVMGCGVALAGVGSAAPLQHASISRAASPGPWLENPIDGQKIPTSSAVYFRWVMPYFTTADTLRWEVELSSDSAFTTTVPQRDTWKLKSGFCSPSTQPQCPSQQEAELTYNPGLSPGTYAIPAGSYYWRVKVTDVQHPTLAPQYSETRTFVVDPNYSGQVPSGPTPTPTMEHFPGADPPPPSTTTTHSGGGGAFAVNPQWQALSNSPPGSWASDSEKALRLVVNDYIAANAEHGPPNIKRWITTQSEQGHGAALFLAYRHAVMITHPGWWKASGQQVFATMLHNAEPGCVGKGDSCAFYAAENNNDLTANPFTSEFDRAGYEIWNKRYWKDLTDELHKIAIVSCFVLNQTAAVNLGIFREVWVGKTLAQAAAHAVWQQILADGKRIIAKKLSDDLRGAKTADQSLTKIFFNCN